MTFPISGLPALVTSLDDADEFAVVDADEGTLANKTKRVSVALMRAAFASSGGAFVFEPGAIPGGVVYDNWTDLHAAASAYQGEKIIVINDTGGDAEVTAGTWDIEGWTFLGIPGTSPYLVLLDGAIFTGAAWGADNVTLSATHTSGYIQDISGTSATVTLRNNARIEGSATNYFFRIRGFGNPNLSIRLEGGSSLGPLTGNVVETSQQGVCTLWFYDQSGQVGSTAIMNAAPGAGSLRLRYYGMSPEAFQTQVNYNDDPTIDRFNDVRYLGEIPYPLIINATQTGTSELQVGSVYLKAGTTVRGSTEAMMGGSGPAETANLRIRRFTGGAQVGGDFTVIGTLGVANPFGGEFTVADSDWYDLYLFAGGVAETAIIKGLRLVLTPSLDNGV